MSVLLRKAQILKLKGEKLLDKNLDLIAVNDITAQNAGFAGDSNQLTLISRDRCSVLPHTTKLKTADLLWDFILDNGLLKGTVSP